MHLTTVCICSWLVVAYIIATNLQYAGGLNIAFDLLIDHNMLSKQNHI